MELPTSNDESALVRQRKGGVKEMVQEFDAFIKLVDDVKEEPKVAKGILSIVSFLLILILLVGQLRDYWYNTEVKYRFSVDIAYDDKPILDLDMIVATPCNNLAIMPMGMDSEGHLDKNPSRFEMTPDETKLWETLQMVHREHFKPGTPLKAINEMTFVRGDVETGLRSAANEKQRLELQELAKQRKEIKGKGSTEDDEGRFVMMIGNGFGMFQVIGGGSGGEEDEGTACRIHGKVPVEKGNGGRLTISIGKTLAIGPLVAHFGGSNMHSNISHRIERFHFGPHIWGLVTPLAGNEQITKKGGTEYKYFLKVVPTRIYHYGLFREPTLTYQYAVTYAKKEGNGREHVHDSITFDYEFVATVIEVHPFLISPVQMLLRVCSVIGGVFATSRFLESYLSKIPSLFPHFSKSS